MYLLKLPSSVYYTRIVTPVKLRQAGFPNELRYSLFTKNRDLAIERNLHVSACVKKHLLKLKSAPATSFTDFQVALLRDIASIRKTYPSVQQINHYLPVDAHENDFIDMGDVDLQQVSCDAPSLTTANTANYRTWLAKFIGSKKNENVIHLTIHQLEQRVGHCLNFFDSKSVTTPRPADLMRYIDLLRQQGRSAKTNKEYFAAVKQFFKWLHAMEYIETNPTDKVNAKFKVVKHASEQRDRWELSELNRLFKSHALQDMSDDFKWITRLQLYMGLRTSEACQLYTIDSQCYAGIHYLQISDSSPLQHLKNEHALRAVPIHPALINKGFIEFVESRIQTSNTPIFNFKPLGKDNDWSKTYRIQFGKLQTRIGMKPKNRPTPYGLRHTFIDELKLRDIKEHNVAEIVGHSNPNMTFGRYGKKLKLTKSLSVVSAFDLMSEEA
ncbi:tyrosine-type recombinase/integrase [Photobacterium sp. ZSDE20]|uniref:Tyrosine-type recombinase/integrase n=1 Tax=Photobacterium pectinilyticum TaxID=2906793 RepID=A0ABT1N482_9GAMM|nr:tyrosine-type recombinase/integrase [Photobacterium sp. ZSDE20]MCQ1059553.1 tyrosine-type recombinase/integrase [Photobacterium sp. ZSDE20]MDD1825416.1 tyrosine-type recombinase/integrase [Photobacterium sp. ZSDE20]